MTAASELIQIQNERIWLLPFGDHAQNGIHDVFNPCNIVRIKDEDLIKINVLAVSGGEYG